MNLGNLKKDDWQPTPDEWIEALAICQEKSTNRASVITRMGFDRRNFERYLRRNPAREQELVDALSQGKRQARITWNKEQFERAKKEDAEVTSAYCGRLNEHLTSGLSYPMIQMLYALINYRNFRTFETRDQQFLHSVYTFLVGADLGLLERYQLIRIKNIVEQALRKHTGKKPKVIEEKPFCPVCLADKKYWDSFDNSKQRN